MTEAMQEHQRTNRLRALIGVGVAAALAFAVAATGREPIPARVVQVGFVVDGSAEDGVATIRTAESDGTGLGPRGERVHDLSFSLHADGASLDVVPEDLWVLLALESVPRVSEPDLASARPDARLVDLAYAHGGAPLRCVEGAAGTPGAVYRKRLPAGSALDATRARLRVEIPQDPLGAQEGTEAFVLRIVAIEPAAESHARYVAHEPCARACISIEDR